MNHEAREKADAAKAIRFARSKRGGNRDGLRWVFPRRRSHKNGVDLSIHFSSNVRIVSGVEHVRGGVPKGCGLYLFLMKMGNLCDPTKMWLSMAQFMLNLVSFLNCIASTQIHKLV